MPDFFEGEYVKGVVSQATFSVKDNRPVLDVKYNAGSEEFTYTSYKWYLTSHKPGQIVTMIYNPSHPEIASIYAFVGYWITWQELFFTAVIFIILFIIAVVITGKNKTTFLTGEEGNRKRIYDD